MSTDVAAPGALSRLLADTGVRLSPRLGQHFLVDASAVSRIVDAAEVGPGDAVLEIGPGAGVLTAALAARGARVAAIEIDRRLAPVLERTVGDRATIVFADALKEDWERVAPAPLERTVVVSNLPYAQTSPLLVRLLERPFMRAVLTMQEEVVDRLLAAPGNRERGSLTVLRESRAAARRLFRIKPGCFLPPPKVMSAVVRLDPEPVPLHPGTEDLWRGLFRYRRKTVRRGLQEAFGTAPGVVQEALARSGVDGGQRPEALPLPAFESLARALAELS